MTASAPAESAIVLTGGRSSRMGRPKAMLPFDGVPLIEHIVGALRTRIEDVVVVAAPEQPLPAMPVTLVRDDVPYQGPVGGLSYGLRAVRGEVCFATSCDSAFLSLPLVDFLLSGVAGYDVVVPHWEGRFQPLHAVYRTSVAPLLEAQLRHGELRPVTLFDRVRTRRVDEEEIRRFDPAGRSFFNMNTPEDYARALAEWRRSAKERRDPGTLCTVELFGVARMLAGTAEIALRLPADATFADVLAALAERLPSLTGHVVDGGGRALMKGYTANVNGREFIRDGSAAVRSGDRVMILSADAGG